MMLNPPSLIMPPLSKNTREGYTEGGGREGGREGKERVRKGREDDPCMVRR